jgi:hypothetical protein
VVVLAGDPRCFGEELHHSNFSDAFWGCGLWRLCSRRPRSMVAECRPAAVRSLEVRVELGEDSRVRGDNSRRPGAPCMSVTRPIKLVRILVGSADHPGGPKNRGNSRIPARVLRVFGRVAVGVGWVYCFLSRREGASGCWLPEAAKSPSEQPGKWFATWRAVRGWGWS